MSLIEHIENNLGQVERGWKPKYNYQEVQCVGFVNKPYKGQYTYCTLGLSEEILKKGKKSFRLELLISVENDYKNDRIASFLINLAEYLKKKKLALLRGEVFPLKDSILEEFGFHGVYASIPVFFDDDFSVYKNVNPSIVFVSLIPLYKSEMNYVFDKGWDKFEDLLEEKDISDFWSLRRKEWIP